MRSERYPQDFAFGADETLLRDTARKLLAERLPNEALRRLVADDPDTVYEHGARPAWDASLWGELVGLGWSGLAVPEECGGVGAKLVGIAALIEEVGRAALPAPLIPTLGASYVLRACGTEAARRRLERQAAGATLSLAWSDAEGSFRPAAVEIAARADGGEWRLSGAAYFVQDAFKVDAFLVAARDEDRVRLWVVRADAPGVEIAQDHIYDLTRDQATVRLREVRVGAEDLVADDAEGVVDAAWPALLVLVAADLCGIGEWQLQTTADYARTRVQFDRPIGFFQAVKHPLVDGMVALDRARALLYHAACCFDVGSAEAQVAARMAKSAAADAGAFLSDRSVQLHGGIGFTWECAVHIHFKRSLHDQLLFGDAIEQRRQLAEFLFADSAS